MVRQYRHATGESLWELVAGRTERGEKPARAARRELEEETGYSGRRFRRLIEFFPTPGFVSERMESVRAQELTHQFLTFAKGGAPVRRIASIEEIIRDYYPDLGVEDIQACVRYAADVVAAEELVVEVARVPGAFGRPSGKEGVAGPLLMRVH